MNAAILPVPAGTGSTFPGLARLRVLVVDDNSAGRYAVCRHLRRAGLQVQEAASGHEALKVIASDPPHLVILDVGLVDMNGFDVCAQIRKEPGSALIPVIHISATFTRRDDRVRGLQGGADAYLAEPIDPRELLAQVEALLRIRSAELAARRHNQRLQALADTAAQLLSETAHEDRLELLFNRVAPELKLDFYASFLAPEETGKPLRVGSWGGASAESVSPVLVAERLGAVADAVVRDRQPSIGSWPSPPSGPANSTWFSLRATACFPLLSGERTLGALFFGSATRERFDEEDVVFLKTISHYVALARERSLVHQLLERTVQERTAHLQATIGELESLSYSLAHDMRAPLRAMHGFVQLLREDNQERLDAEAHDYLRRIANSAQRLDQMIQEVLNYTALVRNGLPLQSVDLDALARELIESYPSFSPTQVDIQITEALPRVIGNTSALTQCLSHLLSNAVKFVRPGTRPVVRIRPERREQTARVWFEDNGIGIAAEHQERIFGLFERLHGPQEYQGTGIGLAVVRKGLERMGGQIGVVSVPGAGSRFWIELPLAGQAECAPVPATSAA